jgi:hypothetical protein
MKAHIVTFRADHGKRVVSAVCVALCAFLVSIGLFTRTQDLAVVAGIMATLSALSFLICDAIVVDGREHVIRRKKGVWPLINESIRPFSDVDHVCLEEMPSIESDGSEITLARLSLVRKFGSPIVLASETAQTTTLRKEAHHLAELIGVEARLAA